MATILLLFETMALRGREGAWQTRAFASGPPSRGESLEFNFFQACNFFSKTQAVLVQSWRRRRGVQGGIQVYYALEMTVELKNPMFRICTLQIECAKIYF